MSKFDKQIQKIFSATSDASIEFDELIKVLVNYGFNQRTKGSHHIFTRSDVAEIINIQPIGSKAKPYQVKQVRQILSKYKLYKI